MIAGDVRVAVILILLMGDMTALVDMMINRVGGCMCYLECKLYWMLSEPWSLAIIIENNNSLGSSERTLGDRGGTKEITSTIMIKGLTARTTEPSVLFYSL